LECARRVDTVLLNKTGTVTTGQMSVLDVTLASDEPKCSPSRARWNTLRPTRSPAR
jgi:cation transport ATPase